ncbi:hypothetical protein ACWCOV_28000 [Kribbella sp. NPDC002412]
MPGHRRATDFATSCSASAVSSTVSGLSVDQTLVDSIRVTVCLRLLPSARMCVAPGTASTPSYGVLSSMNQPHAAA